MSEPLANLRRKVKITKVLSLPVEWTLDDIWTRERNGGIQIVTPEEISTLAVEEVDQVYIDTKQERLDLQ